MQSLLPSEYVVVLYCWDVAFTAAHLPTVTEEEISNPQVRNRDVSSFFHWCTVL